MRYIVHSNTTRRRAREYRVAATLRATGSTVSGPVSTSNATSRLSLPFVIRCTCDVTLPRAHACTPRSALLAMTPKQKRRRTSATGSTRIFEDDVPIAEQLDFLCDAVGRGGETNARNVDAAGGLLTRSLSTTRRAVTATSDSKKAAERAAEQRFINSAQSVPLVPPKQQRLSAAALKRQQLRTMDPTKISPTRRLPSSASAVPAVGVSKSSRQHVAATKLSAGISKQQQSVAQKKAKPFDF